jgi:hypothetical protein
MTSNNESTQKKTRLSNTSTNMYIECGQRYKYHYIDKIRNKDIPSSLFFGNAIDEALNVLLKVKLKDNPVDEDFVKVYNEKMSNIVQHKEEVFLYENLNCVYSKADYSPDLLDKKDIKKLLGEEFKDINLDEFMSSAYSQIREAKTQFCLPEDELKLYNRVCWRSLYKKGLLLLDAYLTNIIPKIDYVLSVQKDIELPNENGDVIAGKIDAILKFKGDDKIYVVDNKTASKAYTPNDIITSKQLATYAEHEGIFDVCYIVLDKNLRIKEPRVRFQILKHKLDESLIDHVFNDYERILQSIKEGKFDKNENKCYNIFGKPCEYLKLCKYGKFDDKKLVKITEDK